MDKIGGTSDLYCQIPSFNLGALVKSWMSKKEKEEKDWGGGGKDWDFGSKQSRAGILVPGLNSRHVTVSFLEAVRFCIM